MSLVKEKIRIEPMFRFDHFLRSRSESELNKRMLSIYKLIEKERDNNNDDAGGEAENAKQSKKKQKKRKQEQKEGILEQEEENEEDISR